MTEKEVILSLWDYTGLIVLAVSGWTLVIILLLLSLGKL